jgi:hypothetical protein
VNCICCEGNGPLAKSHVISNFIRLRLTGIADGKSQTKYHFRLLGSERVQISQDLPKPKLLCTTCDSEFGSTIERPASQVILPQGDVSTPQAWYSLPIRTHELPFKVADLPFKVGSYQPKNFEDDCALEKFAVLTAWRALHAMSRGGDEKAREFLESDDGRILDTSTIQFLTTANSNDYFVYPYLATIHFLGPTYAASVTGLVDEMPFSWTLLQTKEQSAVAVMLGYWVIVWPLLADEDSRRNFHELLKLTYVNWHAGVIRQFRKAV